jgi:hypothetical protein
MSRLNTHPGIALRLIDAGVARVYKSLTDLHADLREASAVERVPLSQRAE